MRQTLVGKRIYFKGLEKSHLSKRVEYINDPQVQATLNFELPATLAKTEAWFNGIVLSDKRVELSIFAYDDVDPIGFCGFIDINRKDSKAEHFIFIGNKSFWNKGIGTEAYKLLTNYGFINLNINKIYGYQLINNKRAQQVVDNLGWHVDGVLRQNRYSHGEYQDQLAVSILQREWYENPLYDEV